MDLPDEKSRPALVLTRAAAIPVLNQVIVALITRKIRGIPTEVPLDEGDGMPNECVISLDNLRTVPHALLGDPITSLSGAKMHEVCRALAVATGCE
ncbi:MAG: type II toxin-antitoxin system PemK/MazF family toxin [Thermoleophilia bacterium]|nr:type II toxin-antitoxin system PemK/MazF family toxin [Thermoleophilia bacterium]